MSVFQLCTDFMYLSEEFWTLVIDYVAKSS